MKNLTKIAAIFVAVILAAAPSNLFAASTSTSAISVAASIPASLTISAVLHKNSSTGTTVTSMDFGTLKEDVANELRSSTNGSTGTGSVVAMLTANSQSLPYVISQTGTALSNGSTTIPSGACTFVPVYASQDNGGASDPGTLGSADTWVSTTGKTIYTSDSAGSLRTIQAHYSVTGDPNAGATTIVPVNQASGSYSATVTFTVTA